MVGTAAIQLVTKCGNHWIVARCQTPGRPEDQNAYRSELIGLLAGVMIAEWLRQQWFASCVISPKVVQIGCDGLTAITNAFEDVALSPTQPQFDVLSTIHASCELSSIRWRLRHMYGHRDNFLSPLTWWERRNVEGDAWAVQFRLSLPRDARLSPPNPRFFVEPAALCVGGSKRSHRDPHFIHDHIALRWNLFLF